MITYGTNPIAWTNDDDRSLGAHISFEQCLNETAQIGFDGIEKGHKFPTTVAGLKEVLDPRGLKFVSGWHSTNLLVNDLETEKAIKGGDDWRVNARPRLKDAEWKAFGAGSRRWRPIQPPKASRWFTI